MLYFKKISTIFIIIFFVTIYTCISFASSDSVYVWSSTSLPIATSSTSINTGTRKFFKFNFWKWHINRMQNRASAV